MIAGESIGGPSRPTPGEDVAGPFSNAAFGGPEARKIAGFLDMGAFAYMYLPHYFRSPPGPSPMHADLFRDMRELILAEGVMKCARAAPRGHAKSTIAIVVGALWMEMYNGWQDPTSGAEVDRRYAPILSDTATQAEQQLACIRSEIEDNERLITDFGERRGDVLGNPWKVNMVVTSTGVRFEAFGAGKKIRGRRQRHKRPDFFFIDDLENKESVESPDQRDKLWEWLTESVVPAGDLQRCSYLYTFTVLHEDAVGARILRNPGWNRRVYRAVISEPRRKDLWALWEAELFKPPQPDQEDDAMQRARAFYEERREDMDDGAEVLWEGDPLYGLMLMRAVEGEDTYWKEKQNDPTSSGERPFAALRTWSGDPRDWLESQDGGRIMAWVIACDPSVGRRQTSRTRRASSRRRDPSAIVAVGIDSKGTLLELGSTVSVRQPDEMYEDMAQTFKAICEDWARAGQEDMASRFRNVVIEINQAQYLFGEGLEKHVVGQHGLRLAIEGITHTSDKDLRIRGMQPRIKHGIVVVSERSEQLLHQVKNYPAAGHDDGPDALEAAIAELTDRRVASSVVPDRLAAVRDALSGPMEARNRTRAAKRASLRAPFRRGEHFSFGSRGNFNFGRRAG